MKDYLIHIGLVIFATFAPVHAMLATTLVLVAVDFFTGVWAAYKRGEWITSANMRRTISKLIIYEIVLMLSFLVETNLLGGALPVCKLAAGMIGAVELKSLLENCNVILGFDLFKSLVASLGSKNERPKE